MSRVKDKRNRFLVTCCEVESEFIVMIQTLLKWRQHGLSFATQPSNLRYTAMQNVPAPKHSPQVDRTKRSVVNLLHCVHLPIHDNHSHVVAEPSIVPRGKNNLFKKNIKCTKRKDNLFQKETSWFKLILYIHLARRIDLYD